ncbi:uncharacterized protein LOC141695825 [Apium graveolens]|uniref:uncharacterized protein LOC141695825 n=1 Tax=Apium graveolens TaxID=4045 RepID=UPI003D79C1A9
MDAQALLVQGISCCIGNGQTVDITNSPWLPSIEDPFVHSDNEAISNQKVASLFKIDEKAWDVELVLDVFEEMDAELILSIPLIENDKDTWYWRHEKMGHYLVKSGFNVIQASKNQPNTVDNSGFWRKLWNLKIPNKIKNFLWRASSNYLPTNDTLQAGRIQFFNFMIDIPGFLDLVSRSWSLACSGSPIHQFNLKLKDTKLALRELNKNHGILQTNLQAFRSKLEDVHLALLSNPLDENLINTERSLINDLNMDLAQEESLLLQKAIIKWMNIDIDISHVDCKMVTPHQASLLEAPVRVFVRLSSIFLSLDSCPQGQHMHGWVCSAVLAYFMGPLTSSPTLVIFKEFKNLKSPTRMQGFHLISLCIVMYKCISKILASRLKLILPSLVDIAQSAFISARSISDNILLAQELFHSYERETSTPKCALKIDLHKAFDSVHWDFILAVLRRVQIPEKVKKCISACIFSTRFSVKLNGVVHGFFEGSKGIRQGDPLSLYIFALCMNVLSCILNKVPEGFKFHWRCKELHLSHLFFEDDVLFFVHGCKINTFSRWSGLSPRIHKSTIFLCNCDQDFVDWFDSTFAIPRGTLPVHFLGVPVISSQVCINDYMPLIEKITLRLNSWPNLLLSLARRTLLIKSVIHAIEAFWGNHILFLMSVHANIQSFLSRFL